MRRRLLVVLLSIAIAASAFAVNPATRKELQDRRANLRKDLDGVYVLFGYTGADGDRMREGFFQEPYFYYLTGWRVPDAITILTRTEELLFLPPRSERTERFYGHQVTAADPDAREATGFQTVYSTSEFEAQLLRVAGASAKIYTTGDELATIKLRGIVSLRPGVTVEDGSMRINRLRMVKSEAELALIQHAVGVSIASQEAAMKRTAPGLFEYQVASAMQSVWEERGCERPAYAPIVGSGPNSIVLHYSDNKRHMDRGEVMVVDAAAECSAYAADITRTLPVNGKFTPRQLEIYNVVLGAQQAAIDAVKPGVFITTKDEKQVNLNQIAKDYMNAHGKDLHGEPLGKYFVHGLSHHVGLDVHDPYDRQMPLAAGMVITVEPGLYLPEENIGIRIEDMVLVTETGHRLMTEALPRDPREIEKRMKH